MSKVDVLAVALFEAYSRNSGNPPDCHYDRNAAEQWMAQALDECGVAEPIAAADAVWRDTLGCTTDGKGERLRAALADIGDTK